jgi:hypothetical protein
MLLLLLAGLYVTGQAQEMAAAKHQLPELLRSTPAIATPGTELELEGYRLGWPDADGVEVAFVQGEASIVAHPTGGGWQATDLDNGLQQMKVVVPYGIEPGNCQIQISVNGKKSAPITIEIPLMVSPPEISEVIPRWSEPGDIVWVSGSGFGESDEIELIDAGGNIHHFPAGSTSTGIKTAFSLPANLPNGETVVKIVEKRSGGNQASNPISFWVNNGPVPLDVWGKWLSSVAPGQWLDLVVTSIKPLERADRAEAAFTQNGKQYIVPIVGRVYPRAHVPKFLLAGDAKITTRTWRNGQPSVWSEPIDYKILDHPASPQVFSLESPTLSQPIYLGPSAPALITLKAGDQITLRGKFPVASGKNLELMLTGEQGSIKLAITDFAPGAIKVQLPLQLLQGNWQLDLRCVDSSATEHLPIKFEID